MKLWADAISINQVHTIERNNQVQHMGQTYAEAEEVLVWLGKARRSSQTLREVGFLGLDVNALTVDEFKSRLEAFNDILSRPWFSRLWIVQEVLLAAKCSVMLGDEVGDLRRLFEVIRMQIEILAQALSLPMHHTPTGSNLDRLVELVRLDKLYRSIPKTGFTDLVVLTAGFDCQDPRDHVFGLVGLARQVQVDCEEVDYTLYTWEVFARFMRSTLDRFSDSLCFFADLVGFSQRHDFPSWLPDLSVAVPTAPWRYKGYNAGGRMTERVAQLQSELRPTDERHFAVLGVVFDTVCSSIATHAEPRGASGEKHSREVCAVGERFFLEDELSDNPYGDRERQYQAYCRNLIGNCFLLQWSPERSTIMVEDAQEYDTSHAYEAVMGRHSGRMDQDAKRRYVDGHRAAYQYTVQQTLAHRAMIRTSQGYFGVGPKASEKDDVIVAVPGLPMLLVLRKRAQGDIYQMVGCAYIHGIMNGEFLNSASQDPDAKLQLFVMD